MTTTNRDFIAQLDAAIGCQQCGAPLGQSPSDDFCSPRCQAAWSAARVEPLTTYVEPDDRPEHVSNLVELHSPETCVACVEGRSHGLRPPWLREPTFIEALHVAARRRRAESFRRLYLNGLVPGVPVVPFTDVEAPASTSNRSRAQVRHTNEPCRAEPFINEAARNGFSFGFDPATREGGGSMVVAHRRDGVDHIEAIFSPGVAMFRPEFAERMRAATEEIGQAYEAAWRGIAPAFHSLAVAVEQAAEGLRPLAEALRETPPEDPRERALWLRQRRNTGPAARNARAPRAINPRRGR